MVCLALPSAGLWADPIIRESIDRYEVRGRTAKELKDGMKRLGPRRGGRRFFGYTNWKVTWKTFFATRGEEWAISSFDVYVDVTTILPYWNHSEFGADPELVERWDQFLRALEAHEKDHRRLGLEAASAVERRLWGLRGENTLDDLEAAIHAAAVEAIDGYRETERRFDENTRHGKTEGARF
jgi:predicted secreted Zn-dependent protease